MSPNEEKTPPENEYADYPIMQSHPWAYALRKQQCVMFKEHRLNLLFKQAEPVETDLNNFTETSDRETMNVFFPNGKYNCTRFGQYVDKFIFWAVTGGCYKSDKNKRVWVWTGDKTDMRHITDIRTKNLWVLMDNGFPIIEEIASECNRVLELLKEALHMKYTPDVSDYFKTRLENLENHPEIVAYQRHLNAQLHKQYRWYFQRPPRQGGKRQKASAPQRIPKISVHQMMKHYHIWLKHFYD
jgi:hypothetical protein